MSNQILVFASLATVPILVALGFSRSMLAWFWPRRFWVPLTIVVVAIALSRSGVLSDIVAWAMGVPAYQLIALGCFRAFYRAIVGNNLPDRPYPGIWTGLGYTFLLIAFMYPPIRLLALINW